MTAVIFCALIRDVFRAAWANGLQATCLVGIAIATCLSSTLTFDSSTKNLTSLYGLLPIATGETPTFAVGQYLFLMAFGIAGALGVVAALMLTSSFLPSFLETSSISVLLSKQPSRTALLMGRIAGVLLWVSFNSAAFVAAVGVAAGLATGIWLREFWLCWPLFMAEFFAFFGFSTLIAVITRNTIAAMLGGIAFWLISWGINFGRHFLATIEIDEARPGFGRLIDWVYWLCPKPADFSVLLYGVMGEAPQGLASLGLSKAQQLGLVSAFPTVASALAVGVVLFLLAAYEFEHQDY